MEVVFVDEKLLSKAAVFAFENGKKEILQMIDTDAIVQLEAARLTGFRECGKYIAYRGLVG